jgi:benzaldehyde dehydrogenase (NAD)
MTLLEDGRWHDRVHVGGWTAGSGGTHRAVAPATGETLGGVGNATPDDVGKAAGIAAEAQLGWARVKPAERAAVLRRAGELWERHAAEVQDWLVREAGSTRPKAAIETGLAAGICFEAASLPTHPLGEVLSTGEPRWSLARQVPAGVVSVISPFNFPLILSIRSVAPALALGNAVLLKPDLRTAVSGGVSLVRVFEEAGLPAGLLHLLPGDAAVGAAVVDAPEVSVVSFTGSTAAGRKVGEAAARSLKRVHLELGGNNALVVLPGADVAKAASAGAFGSFLHQGQICMATGRHLVHESQVDAYAEALAEKARRLPVGDPAAGGVALGPIIDARQLAHVTDVVDRSVAAGAKVLAGGKPDAPYYPPTVLTGLGDATPAWREEIFGPVAPVRAYRDLDEAARLVNDSEYGLSVGILGDVGTAMTLADRVRSGKVHINEQTVGDEPTAPFGGVGDSGNGSRFGGARANIEAFTETQWVTVRADIAGYPF